jgi:hypothetical protein
MEGAGVDMSCHQRRAKVQVAFLAVLTLLLGACGGQRVEGAAEAPTVTASGSYPARSSVESLAKSADAVVILTVGDVVDREVDYGGNPPVYESGAKATGIPMEYREVKILKILSQKAEIGKVRLGYPDQANTQFDVTALVSGQMLLMFLDHVVKPSDVIGRIREVWVPLSGDSGVFDLAGETARARGRCARPD